MAFAQNNDQNEQGTAQTDQGNPPAPAPAFGQSAPILSPENPPISGIDEPRLDLRRALRSFVSVGLQASESGDSNPSNQLGNGNLSAVSRILGAADLQRFWAKNDLIAEYLGGGAFYTSGIQDVRQLQALGVLGTTRWRTGQLTVRDSFNYLPEGSFSAGAYGGTPGLGLAETGGYGLPGGGLPGTRFQQFGAVGLVSRITNVSLADIVQSISPRSAVTIVAGYDFSHFLEFQNTLFNSQQVLAEGGYSYMLNRRDQIGVIYGFEQFHFPQSSAGSVTAHILNVRWGRTISGRMSFVGGIGPQYISVYNAPLYCYPGSTGCIPSSVDDHWGVAGRASLHYQFTRSTLTASYEKFTSAGSGLFAGANTQVARLSLSMPLSRTWEFLGDLGYAHNTRLGLSASALNQGIPGNTYNNGFFGMIFRKQIGRNYGAFGAYRFNALGLDTNVNNGFFGKGRISERNIVTVGVDWHPRPHRIE
jgi:hypothetical protein